MNSRLTIAAHTGSQAASCHLSAVLKRHNLRSLRLLERLGFTVAPAQTHSEHGVQPDEVFMQREIQNAHELRRAL
jgi:hypothetical protein